MCGLFGSKDTNRFAHLYALNRPRGGHSHSISHKQGNAISTQRYLEPDLNMDNVSNEYEFIIGHVQAPTTEARGLESVHPAQIDSNLLWHNGIIKDNQVKLWQQELETNEQWDTKLFLQKIITNSLDSLSTADGSFACVLLLDKELLLFRNDNCPMFVDRFGSFSSVGFAGCFELPANKVYKYSDNEWIETDQEFGTQETFYWSP